jgi:recombination DNA repair RAD52 pathway protein
MIETEWFKNIKPGDKVVVVSSSMYDKYHIQTVDRITLTGIIILKNGEKFNKNGRERSKKRYQNRRNLIELTPDLKHQLDKKELWTRIYNINFEALDYEQLKQIWKIVTGDDYDAMSWM